jgi:hypothetical protein
VHFNCFLVEMVVFLITHYYFYFRSKMNARLPENKHKLNVNYLINFIYSDQAQSQK